jgi:hypothetical protein
MPKKHSMFRKETKRDDQSESGAVIDCLSAVANALGQANSAANNEYRLVTGVIGGAGVILD